MEGPIPGASSLLSFCPSQQLRLDLEAGRLAFGAQRRGVGGRKATFPGAREAGEPQRPRPPLSAPPHLLASAHCRAFAQDPAPWECPAVPPLLKVLGTMMRMNSTFWMALVDKQQSQPWRQAGGDHCAIITVLWVAELGPPCLGCQLLGRERNRTAWWSRHGPCWVCIKARVAQFASPTRGTTGLNTVCAHTGFANPRWELGGNWGLAGALPVAKGAEAISLAWHLPRTSHDLL